MRTSAIKLILVSQLLIGLLMAGVTISGYAGTGDKHMADNFLDSEWRDAVLTLLVALNTSMGQPDLGKLNTELQEDALLKLIEQLATGRYQPDEWFSRETVKTDVPRIKSEAPSLNTSSKYRLLCLTAADNMSQFISKQFDGILFEDPFYAIMASYNIGRWKRLYVLPAVSSREQAWQRRTTILEALQKRTYQPTDFFVECLPIGNRGDGMPVKILTIPGEQLQPLYQNGTGDIRLDDGGGWFSLYQFVPPQ
jgi:hypothetical protein